MYWINVRVGVKLLLVMLGFGKLDAGFGVRAGVELSVELVFGMGIWLGVGAGVGFKLVEVEGWD